MQGASMLYCNRTHAGEELAAALRRRGIRGPLVLGINRGGVPVAIPVARALGAELEFVAAMKLRAPWNPEVAIGAITADGLAHMEESIAMVEGVDKGYLAAEKTKQTSLARQREKRFGVQRAGWRGRPVILVHDGIATGVTATAAIRSIRAAGSAGITLVSPVALPSSLSRLRGEADEVICPKEDPQLFAVGEVYGDFRSIEDAEIDALLKAYRRAREAFPCPSSRGGSSPKGDDSLAIWGVPSRQAIDWFEHMPMNPGGAPRLSRS
jgi:putative phosphoribosyl transferase